MAEPERGGVVHVHVHGTDATGDWHRAPGPVTLCAIDEPCAPDRPTLERRRARRRSAAVIALAGLLDLTSGLTPPVESRLHVLVSLVPLAVPQVATSLVVLAGVALVLLARGVRHGQRHAWQLAVALLAASVALHVAKGGDLEEGAVALAALVYLLRRRGAFTAVGDSSSAWRALGAVGVGCCGVAVGVVVVLTSSSHLTVGRAVAAAAERIVDIHTIPLSRRVDDFLDPALAALGFGVALAVGWLVSRPVVVRHRTRAADDRAADIVRRWGGDTLSYFALRDDKQHVVFGDTLVAFAVLGGVCLVSPDPIGPPGERARAWRAFRRFTDDHGWGVAVMGAGEAWLPVYRAAGMKDVYIGDEAVVDVTSFSLDGGGRTASLRKAVNRMARHGYRVDFHDPAALDPGLQAQLRELMTKSRRGEVERGFSMTLGRVFDPADAGLLLAVASGPDGAPVAFCQYVPAADIGGWSLDLMRRDDGEHPNGLLDLVVVETIRYLQARGDRGLGLNFATMRAVLAGERGDGATAAVKRWVLEQLSGSMQIESLWKYNEKFRPAWRPRFAVYDAAEQFLPAALAVARAESFTELPLIGRWLAPAPAG